MAAPESRASEIPAGRVITPPPSVISIDSRAFMLAKDRQSCGLSTAPMESTWESTQGLFSFGDYGAGREAHHEGTKDTKEREGKLTAKPSTSHRARFLPSARSTHCRHCVLSCTSCLRGALFRAASRAFPPLQVDFSLSSAATKAGLTGPRSDGSGSSGA